ncbi:MAG: radical SAM protein [Candidatus Wallbacteria bacterium]|nr:radical SAM protein [Candidatus Wallbacteria bacterium]
MRDLGPDLLGALQGERAFVGPEHVVVDLTNRCNTNCIACWTYSPLLRDKAAPVTWKKQELPGPVASRLIDDLAVIGTRRVRFTGGGEPMLHPGFHDLVRRIKDRGLVAQATTNLIVADAGKLLASGIDEITASLWASNASMYTRTHPNQGPATFPRIRRTIEELAASPRRPRLTFANVLSRINFHELEQMYDFAVEVKADAVYFTLVDPVQDRTEGLMLTAAERLQTLEATRRILTRAEALGPTAPQLDAVGEFMGRLAGQGAAAGFYDAVRVDELPCTIGWTFARILAGGDVVPCCRAVAVRLGNLNELAFPEIWFSSKYDAFRKKALATKKSDPYFKEIDCYRMCDNLMHNRQFDARMKVLGPEGLAALRTRLDGYLEAAARLEREVAA